VEIVGAAAAAAKIQRCGGASGRRPLASGCCFTWARDSKQRDDRQRSSREVGTFFSLFRRKIRRYYTNHKDIFMKKKEMYSKDE
jgi:hypothetical protein